MHILMCMHVLWRCTWVTCTRRPMVHAMCLLYSLFPFFSDTGSLIHLAEPSGQRAEGSPDFAQIPVLQIQTQVSTLVQQITH